MSRKAWLAAVSQGGLLLALGCNELVYASLSNNGLYSIGSVTGLSALIESDEMVPATTGTLGSAPGTGTASGRTGNLGVGGTAAAGSNPTGPIAIRPAYAGGESVGGVTPTSNSAAFVNFMTPINTAGMGP